MGAVFYHAANFANRDNFKKPQIYILVLCKAGITCDRYTRKPYTSLTDNNVTLFSARKATFYFHFN